ncbi:phosphate ABC transporter substrate-binding protein PstS [Thermodesulfatator autotrophicus]|uniref:Phosphate-binding protein n=1 Tax=Thermodesulfatator autotrophicus TaxID=1795632 RepID=A0A177E641_9BACT|nr:phosphate ABC transporter substrate-binding protein PstS [Thermodesulfatator autotrophicus]OAG27414.1 phosphate ABC transporter substrate-binding protein [Thermodesulfatator autotrophicus]
MHKWLMVLMLFLFSVTGVQAAKLTLLGAGATFPYPLYSKWFDVYYKKTGIKVNYQAIGSGGGIRQLLARTVDFGATDAPMKDSDLAKAPGKILHIPMTLGAVAVAFNIPGVTELKLTPEALVGIFLGKITKWNDPAIQSVNDAKLPNMPIIVARRSDSSGTTYIFTDYLCKVSNEWCEKVGRGKSVRWPVGMGGKGNAGVAGLIKQIPGTIGYIEVAYAKKNNIPVAALRNKAGNFVKPTLKAISAAANIDIPDDTRCSLTNTDAPNGYPISSFTWIILYQEQNYKGRSYDRAKELVKLLWWCIHDAQQYNEKLLYGKLPPIVVHKGEKILKSVTYNGKPIL